MICDQKTKQNFTKSYTKNCIFQYDTRTRHALNCYCMFKPSLAWGTKHFLKVWPQWKDGIADDMKNKIHTIGLYGR